MHFVATPTCIMHHLIAVTAHTNTPMATRPIRTRRQPTGWYEFSAAKRLKRVGAMMNPEGSVKLSLEDQLNPVWEI